MIKIAHRGNTDGPNPEMENHPDYLMSAISKGYHAEVDAWFLDNKFILGHDAPQYEVAPEFLWNRSFWHHAKNIAALFQLNKQVQFKSINCFFHDTDDCVLTSSGWIWTYPGKELTIRSIAVMPERVPEWDISQAGGICTDFPNSY